MHLSDSYAATVRQLQAVQPSINYIVALGSAVTIASNIHQKVPCQQRRNQISDKAMAAFDEAHELLQAKALKEEVLMRADMYLVLAGLAEVNEVILRDAGDEELFEKLEALEQANEHFEETTKQLGQEAKEVAGKK